jgi:hypothetical protein
MKLAGYFINSRLIIILTTVFKEYSAAKLDCKSSIGILFNFNLPSNFSQAFKSFSILTGL